VHRMREEIQVVVQEEKEQSIETLQRIKHRRTKSARVCKQEDTDADREE
jgi:hypothetical protein